MLCYVIFPPCISFVRTTLNLDQLFFFVHWQMKTSFSTTIMGSYTSENNCSGQWRRESTGHMYTTLMGLLDLASDGSPLFAEPMFLLGWALCNTSTYYMLTFWLSFVNYVLRGEFPLLHRLLQYIFTYPCFGYPELIFLFKACFLLYYFVFLKQTFVGTKVLMRWMFRQPL